MDNKVNESRRQALKKMGLAVAGALAASTGILPLVSCGKKEKKQAATAHKKSVVLYFTGTGNCFYVARELAGPKGEMLSIPQLMKDKTFDIEADEIGIVYPIYGHMPPNMVRKFIAKANLKAQYLFAVLTYGNRHANAVEIWNGIATAAGKKFDYINTLIMVDNWLPNFDMNEQVKTLPEKKVPEHIAEIRADIDRRRKFIAPVTEEERQQHQGFMERSGLDPEVGFLMKSENYFKVNPEACIGCGVCVNVCPKANWKLDPWPKVEGDCEFCFACIQNCPQKAILFIESEENAFLQHGEVNPKARYRNEHVSLYDIKASNNQF